jgi:hypothetical protein
MPWPSAKTILEWLWHFWPFLLSGIVAILPWAIYQIRSRRAQSWPVVDGAVESHSLHTEYLGSHRREIAEISYSYTVNREYYSGIYRVSGEWQFVHFPRGSRVVVRYKPSDPSTSLLDREHVRLGKLGTGLGC